MKSIRAEHRSTWRRASAIAGWVLLTVAVAATTYLTLVAIGR